MRFLILVMWISTILAATVPAQGKVNTTTIITHGFQGGNTPGIWLTTMAEEIVRRGWSQSVRPPARHRQDDPGCIGQTSWSCILQHGNTSG
jgi:predicted alpha/beta-fold hydrolase